jgi:hypothetical protein
MEITRLGNHILVEIHKPMSVQPDYDFVRVRKDYFDLAKKKSLYVLVRTPNGERIFMPKGMRKFKVVKEVFLFKDRPMKMYELIIPHSVKKDNDYYIYTNI